MNQKTLAMVTVLMGAAVTGIFVASPLAYAESDCESSAKSFKQCLRDAFGTAFIEDEADTGETIGGEFLASDAAEEEAVDAEDEGAFQSMAPTKQYQVWATLTNVPPNAPDLEVNATILRMPFFVLVSNTVIDTVTSPSEGELIKFQKLRVPAGSNENAALVCGHTSDFSVSNCKVYPLPSTGGGPIRVDFPYPNCVGCG